MQPSSAVARDHRYGGTSCDLEPGPSIACAPIRAELMDAAHPAVTTHSSSTQWPAISVSWQESNGRDEQSCDMHVVHHQHVVPMRVSIRRPRCRDELW